MKKIFTKGNVEVQNIKIGDVHYEFEYGLMIKSVVQTLPKDDGHGYWSWTSKDSKGKIINYGVREGMGHYGPNLYNYIAYPNCKEI